MSTSALARPHAAPTSTASSDPAAISHARNRARRRPALLGLLLAAIVLVAAGCDSTKANTDYAMVNGLRARYGVQQLARSAELDARANEQAARMAAASALFHSPLPAGITPGWKMLAENVAMGLSIESAQASLEASPSHLQNLVNPAFNQVGIGVKTLNGYTWVVQIFAQR